MLGSEGVIGRAFLGFTKAMNESIAGIARGGGVRSRNLVYHVTVMVGSVGGVGECSTQVRFVRSY